MRDGWVEYKFKDVATAVKGKLPKSKNEDGLGLPYLTASYLRSGKPDYWIENLEGAVTAEDSDCLILWDGAGAGDLFSAHRGVVSSTMAVVTTQNSKILREFLTLFISSKAEYIKETCRGTTVPHVSPDAIANMDLKIPPLPEQKRIVDLISSIDSYIEALQQQLESAKSSRSAVMHDLFTSNDSWPEIGLEDLENSGVIKLGRGDVISKKDMEADPGPNPVYSSAENKNGMIGQYAKFMFDEELITWSIDGGGHIFFRPKHKFSVTNIGGWLRILDESIFSYKFLTFALQRLHTQHHFDWQSKAHPSVLRTLYTRIPSPTLAEQNRIVGIISAIDEQIRQSNNAVRVVRDLRSGLLSDLVSGEHEIPASYDKVIGAA